MSLAEDRYEQLFPVFDPVQVEAMTRFASGPAKTFARGDLIFDSGERHVPAYLVLEGTLEIVRRDGLHRFASVIAHDPGQFSGEVSQLSGHGSIPSGRAGPTG